MSKVNFTKELLLSAKPKEGQDRLVLWDAKVPGLQCRISQNGSATFSVFKRGKGISAERITLGKFPQMTIEQARVEAAKINAAIMLGENPAETRRNNKGELSVYELFNQYLEEYVKMETRSYRSYKSLFDLYIANPLGKRKVSRVDINDIEDLFRKISQQTIKVKKAKNPKEFIEKQKRITANRVVALISSAYNWGIKNRKCKHNPARGVEKNPAKSRDRFLQAEELKAFFKAVHSEENDSIRDYILLSLYTGARRSNVVSMRWADISLKNKIWLIPHTKNGDPVAVPLIDEAIEILENRFNNDSEYVLPGSGKDGHLIDPKKGWKRILEKSGLENLRPHDLRRTLGSWQAITGSSLLIIGKSLGHKSSKATEVYARLNLDPVRKSIETAIQGMLEQTKEGQ